VSTRLEHGTIAVRDLNSILNGQNRGPTTKKPFDVLAEGIVSEKSRGEWTRLELFLTGVKGWEAGLRRKIGLQSQ
jgi:hypothetical protein